MIFYLSGVAKHYDWGGESFLSHLFHLMPLDFVKCPDAEYWFGTHPSGVSSALVEGKWQTLDDVLAKKPHLLGEKSVAQFGHTLPFLLKVLDVEKPLSIQLHPTKKEAEYGFEQEEKQGIPLDSPNRTYKDRNHKPEMMIALSDFWLLHGFRPLNEMIDALNQHASLAPLVQSLEQRGLPSTYAQIMQASQSELAEWLLPIIHSQKEAYQQGKLKLDNPDYWLLYAMEAMEIREEKLDAGLLSFYLFNLVHLKKGEGIYQGAGLPHAYLRGQNIELMATSDNVIRGGLTSKYVDIPALLNTIDYREIRPKIIPEYTGNETLHRYDTPEAKDFALQRLSFNAFDEEKIPVPNATILLVMEGKLHLDLGNDNILSLGRGDAVFIGANTLMDMMGEQEGYAVLASIPTE